jgi:hypothetical protein
MYAYSFPEWKKTKQSQQTKAPPRSMATTMSEIGQQKIVMRKVDWPTTATPRMTEKKRMQQQSAREGSARQNLVRNTRQHTTRSHYLGERPVLRRSHKA